MQQQAPAPIHIDDFLNNRETIVHYNPEQIPPDWNQARNHLRATSVGFLPDDKKTNFTIDPSSTAPIEKDEYPLCIPRKQLNAMGSGYPLYFEFLVYCCYILLAFIAVSGAYNLATNERGTDCLQNTTATYTYFNATSNTTKTITYNREINGEVCANSWSITLSIANKGSDETLSDVQHYVNLAAFVVVIAILHIFRRKQGITNLFVDESSLTASDYTLMVTRVPPGAPGEDVDDSLKQFFENQVVKGKKIGVRKVNLGYGLIEYFDLREKRTEELAKKKEFYRLQHQKKKYNEQQAAAVDAKLEQIHQELHKMELEFQGGVSSKFCGVAFVSFNTQAELKEVLAAFEESLWRHFVHLISRASGGDGYPVYKGQYIQVKQAPEPSDVKWENLGAGKFRVFRRRAVSWILALILLGGCFAAIYFMTTEANQNNDPAAADSISVRALSIGAAILVSVLNVVLKITMRKLSDYELYDTVTKHNISLASKLALVQFVNTAMITFIAALVANNYFSAGGMTESITNMFISNAVIGPLMSFMDLAYQFQCIKRWWQSRKGNESSMTQDEANTLFEGNDFDIAARYAEVLKTMFFTAFYAHVIPLGFLISLVFIVVTYWVDKYTLLRRSKEPRALGGPLSIEMTEMIEYILPLYAAGQIVFDKIILDDISWVSWLVLGLSVMNAFLPMQAINELIFPIREEKVTHETYDDVRVNFVEEYDRENPATHEAASHEYHHFVATYTGKVALKKIKTMITPKSKSSPIRMNSPKMQYNFKGIDAINETGNISAAFAMNKVDLYANRA